MTIDGIFLLIFNVFATDATSFFHANYKFDSYYGFLILATFTFFNSKMQGVALNKQKELQHGPTKQQSKQPSKPTIGSP